MTEVLKVKCQVTDPLGEVSQLTLFPNSPHMPLLKSLYEEIIGETVLSYLALQKSLLSVYTHEIVLRLGRTGIRMLNMSNLSKIKIHVDSAFEMPFSYHVYAFGKVKYLFAI